MSISYDNSAEAIVFMSLVSQLQLVAEADLMHLKFYLKYELKK